MVRLSALFLAYLTLTAGLTGVRDDHDPAFSAGAGIPFGLSGISGRKLVDPYTSGLQQARPETILQDLAMARARGARMIVNFAGGSDRTTDADGHFSYELWKARVDRFLPIIDQLNSYVADGTLFLFYVIDEPFAKQRWGGTVPMATIDQMAQYSKSFFPDLPTAVRAAPTELRNYRWQYVDVAWAQYTSRKGGIAGYASTQAATAREEGLGLVVGLNISKGGDGSSGFGSPKEPSMSGAEILRYGQTLLQIADACAFISWDNRPSVIGRPDVAAALRQLALAAKAHPEAPCRRTGRPSSP
jgi:hypothetical protein